jgi:hypothetical protein
MLRDKLIAHLRLMSCDGSGQCAVACFGFSLLNLLIFYEKFSVHITAVITIVMMCPYVFCFPSSALPARISPARFVWNASNVALCCTEACTVAYSDIKLLHSFGAWMLALVVYVVVAQGSKRQRWRYGTFLRFKGNFRRRSHPLKIHITGHNRVRILQSLTTVSYMRNVCLYLAKPAFG